MKLAGMGFGSIGRWWAGRGESGGGFVEHRGESAGAAGEDGLDRCDETGADASAGVVWGAAGVAGGAGANGGGEAARQVSRERTALTREQTRLLNQMRGWLARWRRRGLGGGRSRGGRPSRTGRDALPAPLQTRLARASERLAMVETQRTGLDRAQQAEVRAAPAGSALARLVQLKGVAATSATVLLEEGWLAGIPQSPGGRGLAGVYGRRRMAAGTCSTTRGSVGPAITGCR